MKYIIRQSAGFKQNATIVINASYYNIHIYSNTYIIHKIISYSLYTSINCNDVDFCQIY